MAGWPTRGSGGASRWPGLGAGWDNVLRKCTWLQPGLARLRVLGMRPLMSPDREVQGSGGRGWDVGRGSVAHLRLAHGGLAGPGVSTGASCVGTAGLAPAPLSTPLLPIIAAVRFLPWSPTPYTTPPPPRRQSVSRLHAHVVDTLVEGGCVGWQPRGTYF